MSAPVLNFTPRAELQPSANLAAFVELCRNSEVLDAKRQFAKDVWDVGYLKGHNKVHRAVFSTLEAASDNKPQPSLPPPFLDFAKATLIYLHDKQPVISQATRIASLRCLEAALRESGKGSRPTAVDQTILDSAVEIATKQVSPGVAYGIGCQLKLIAGFMCSKGFITLRQRWAHGLKNPQELGSRISKEAFTARQERLPSRATLRALGAIFYQAIEPVDVLVSSNTALMLCAPERINETLRLRRNCLVEGAGEYRGKLGLRWSGSKGFKDTTKWLPTEMAPIARQAVIRIIQVTGPSQKLAAWYTANPNKLYLHEGAEHLRDRRVLTLSEIGLVLWGDETAKESASVWAQHRNKLPKLKLGDRSIGFFLQDVERAVIAMLPATFPSVPGSPELLCLDALAIMRTNELNPTRPTYLCMFTCVDYSALTNHFGGYKDKTSIFKRFGYFEDDGSPIELQSHSLRHYLNMLAQTGGLSSTEIAIFSGRTDVKQNRSYDHMTSDEVQAPINQALKNGFTSELEPIFDASRPLVTRGEFKRLSLTAAHTTEYGWCIHDFASEPCQMYRDCINCEEQECFKGEEQKEANLRMLKEETEYLLNQAREALGEEEYGADTWVKHQSNTLHRVNALLTILEDPAVPDGARIRLDVANAQLITADNVRPVKVVKKMQGRTLP
ncbi:integrase [Massilia aurea]|uniref:integrase n=1 Tax=Massilia aurea TaxID=373040 RepID=UPI003462D083